MFFAENPNELENTCFRCWKTPDGILWTAVKLNTALINLSHAKENTETIIKLSEGKFLPLVVDLRNLKDITQEARDHFAMRNRKPNVSSIALLIHSEVGKFFGNLYLKISKPSVPTRLCTTENEATDWAKKHLPKR